MTTAQDIMKAGVHYIPATETLDRAAQVMRDHDIGALPVCAPDGKMTGIVTDRDIVTKCVAMGHDPANTNAGDIVDRDPAWIDAAAELTEALGQMRELRIRRLPVMRDGELAGMITEADIVRQLPEGDVHAFVTSIYAEA